MEFAHTLCLSFSSSYPVPLPTRLLSDRSASLLLPLVVRSKFE